MNPPRLITADTLGTAAEQILRDHLPATIELLGWHIDSPDPEDPTRPRKKLAAPKGWDQVPTLEALTSANVPAGAITSPGLVAPPIRKSAWGGYDATWRLSIGVYDRGTSYNDTAARVRHWAALIRAVMILHPSLGGVASSLVWVGEEYRQVAVKSAARTIGGCAVAFDVTADNVVDLEVGPIATTASTSLTVKPVQE